MASTAFSTVPWAVIMITGISECPALMCSKSWMPSMPGIFMSVNTMSTSEQVFRVSRASGPLLAVEGFKPLLLQNRAEDQGVIFFVVYN